MSFVWILWNAVYLVEVGEVAAKTIKNESFHNHHIPNYCIVHLGEMLIFSVR